MAAHAVARVDDDLERADTAHVDQRAEVRGVVGEGVAAADVARAGGGRGGRGGVVQPALDEGADLGEAGVLADGGGSGAAELDAVVLRRVVRGGEHRAGQAEGSGGVVELVGGAEADLDHVEALLGGAPGEGVGEARRGGAHVVADDDRPAAAGTAVTWAKAAPKRAERCSSHWSGTTPRTSYALTICERSAVTAGPSCRWGCIRTAQATGRGPRGGRAGGRGRAGGAGMTRVREMVAGDAAAGTHSGFRPVGPGGTSLVERGPGLGGAYRAPRAPCGTLRTSPRAASTPVPPCSAPPRSGT